jgi:predicted kinase
MKEQKYFKDVKDPSMNELIYWFLVECTELADAMKNSYHEVTTNEPNPYHIEGDVFCHTMLVCQRAEIMEVQKINKICALLHDIGKPMAMDTIPFEAKKPVHSESNEIRNNGKNDGKHSGLNRVMPKSGLKKHFRGHEPCSFYLAIEPLQKLQEYGVLTQKEVQDCLTIISMHGSLFDNIDENGEMKKAHKVFDKFVNDEKLEDYIYSNERFHLFFEDEINLFNAFVTQVKCDSLGRFFASKDGRKNNAYRLGTKIFTEQDFVNRIEERIDILKNKDFNKVHINKPWIEVLIGIPGSGKSNYVESKVIPCEDCNGNGFNMVPFGPSGDEEVVNCSKCKASGKYQNYVVISRDNTLMRYAAHHNIKGNYSEVWKQLCDEDQKAIDRLLEDDFKRPFNNRQNIVVDMTNCSAKSQRKWANKANVPKIYKASAVVFATPYNEVQRRLKKREKETGKAIPDFVVDNMMKSFMVPNFTNFSEIKWVF